jgi:A/G-specific adenine glycosylase
MDRRPHRGQAREREDGEGRLSPHALAEKLVAWYRRARRDLPWRRTSDPYRIWLSETMLQQTRVETVIPYYERFLARFPTLDALAAADEEDVLREWAGLGYYARARNLHRAAGAVVRDHEGVVPRDAAALAALPGVGRYTTGALRSIAFGERAALVDGNVKRVLARLSAWRAPTAAQTWRLAEALVPEKDAGDWNQALMELGATVCTPRRPTCLLCPVESLCGALRSGDPERFPTAAQRAAVRPVRALAGLVERRGRVLLVRRPSRGLLGGLWELPNAEGGDAEALVAALRERTGIRTAPGGVLGQVRHRFTHRDLRLEVMRLTDSGGRLRPAVRREARFCGAAELARLPLSALAKKALALRRPM